MGIIKKTWRDVASWLFFGFLKLTLFEVIIENTIVLERYFHEKISLSLNNGQGSNESLHLPNQTPTWSLQVVKRSEIPIDILFADHYVGADVVERAVEKKLGDTFVRIATPEDLIVLKSLADRAIDRRDIEELRELFKGKLDEGYIQKKLQKIKKMLEE